MKEFEGKVAVITGAGNGIGRAITKRCIKEGMKVVMADIDGEAMHQVEEEMNTRDTALLTVLTDVSKAEEVERLAKRAIGTFGAVHLVFNNAGVTVPGIIWQHSLTDWEWIIGVNLWGVIHGIRVFVPLMLEQGTEGHIVNTASPAGLVAGPGWGIYRTTKHAVVSLSETLYYEFAQIGAKLKVSVLCPEAVKTQFVDSALRRPEELSKNLACEKMQLIVEKQEKALRRALQGGVSPDEVADHVFDTIKEEKFYIFIQSEWKERVRTRMEDILYERNPTISEPMGKNQ